MFITNWAIIPDVMRFKNADATCNSVSGPNGTAFAGGIAPSIETEYPISTTIQKQNARSTHAQSAFWSWSSRSAGSPTIPIRNQMPATAATNITAWRRETRRSCSTAGTSTPARAATSSRRASKSFFTRFDALPALTREHPGLEVGDARRERLVPEPCLRGVDRLVRRRRSRPSRTATPRRRHRGGRRRTPTTQPAGR